MTHNAITVCLFITLVGRSFTLKEKYHVTSNRWTGMERVFTNIQTASATVE